MSAPAFTPGPLDMLVSNTPSANNSFHLYLADKDRRKIAALWGSSDEKLANGYLWTASPELYDSIDVASLRKAAELLKGAGSTLYAGLITMMADKQERALAKARGEQ